MPTLNAPGSAPVSVLPENQRAALISLLADDDSAIYDAVRKKLVSYGSVAADWLRPYLLSNDPTLRRRATEIVAHFARQQADRRFVAFCQQHGEDFDLEHAAGLLAQTQYPEINLAAYSALYDAWAGVLQDRLTGMTQPELILKTVQQYLFKELGFNGTDQYGLDPECAYLNRIVDRRVGNPIGLCAIYLFIARRLRLPVTGIGLPGHFVCRYQHSTQEVFIDCFHKGLVLSKGDCVKYLVQAPPSPTGNYFAPVSARRILNRMCGNLHQTYGQLEIIDQARRFQRYVSVLSKPPVAAP